MNPGTNSFTKTLVVLGTIVLAGSWWWTSHLRNASGLGSGKVKPATHPEVYDEALGASDPIGKALDMFRQRTAHLQPGAALSSLKEALERMDRVEAVGLIKRHLALGDDIATGLDLQIGDDQALLGWPSLRVFLLDMLLALDAEAAAEAGRAGLRAVGTPDEWAVAMRNVARGSDSAEDAALLKAKSAEMLDNVGWRSNPSAGYLEAFDVIVHTRNTSLVPRLLTFCDSPRDQQALRHASFLALDRLVLAAPAESLPLVANAAASHPASRLMISNLVARGDVRDPEQRRAIEAYLLDEARTMEELRAFAGVFPNANHSISHNLLTENPMIDGRQLAEQDRASLAVVEAWLQDTRFSRSHPLIQETHARLQTFVTQ